MPKIENRIWIELDQPVDPADAAKKCELANNMLRRLNDGVKTESTFWWSAHETCYCYGGNQGYIVLTEDGNWFNLDHLGRPFAQ